MEKLYYINRELKTAKSEVIDVINLDEGRGVVLNQTIFFPGGGGQARDYGWIVYKDKKIEIKKLLEVDGRIVHILEDNSISIGSEVVLELDWEKRLDGMQQHSAQHVLSGCFFTKYKRNTKALHIGKEVSQLDIEGSFTKEEVFEIEKMANSIINIGIEIEHYILEDKNRANAYTRRPLPNTEEEIRILKIGELDSNACCGVHMNNTRDIGLIKIKRFYKHKGNTRFEFLAGKRAVDYSLGRDIVFTEVLEEFNCGEDNIINAIENLRQKKDELYDERRYTLLKCVEFMGKSMVEKAEKNKDGILLIKEIFDKEEDFLIKELAKNIAQQYKAIVFFANRDGENTSVLLQCEKALVKDFDINLGRDFKAKKDIIDIRGGGSPFQAQGRSKTEKDIDIFIDSLYSIYSE